MSLPSDTAQPGIGYKTVAEALSAMRAKPGVSIRNERGWIVIDDSSSNTFWSFSPPDYPAYPAAVKRTLIEKDGGISLNMRVLCQASKGACDALVEEFQKLNQRIAADVRGN